MSKRISELPAAATVTGSDQLEADQAGTSKRWSVDQVVNYLSSLNPFSFTSIQVAGASSFSGGNIIFDASGNVDFVNVFSINSLAQEIDLVAGASIFGPASAWSIDTIGNAQFKGSVQGDANTFSLNGIDGSAHFANNAFNIDTDGSLSAAGANFTVTGSGTVNAQGDSIVVGGGSYASNLTQFSADGSAIFAGGAATINAAGEVVAADYWVGGDAGATQDVSVLTALPSTFTVLHFIGGIFVGTTP